MLLQMYNYKVQMSTWLCRAEVEFFSETKFVSPKKENQTSIAELHRHKSRTCMLSFDEKSICNYLDHQKNISVV
jgi:hypothetical protein